MIRDTTFSTFRNLCLASGEVSICLCEVSADILEEKIMFAELVFAVSTYSRKLKRFPYKKKRVLCKLSSTIEHLPEASFQKSYLSYHLRCTI